MDVRSDCAAFLNQLEADTLVRDFETGFGEMEAVLETKWAFWDTLPHLLCGVAAANVVEARGCATLCLETYSQVPAESAHHRVANKFLNEGSVLGRQFRAFVAGAPLAELSLLELELFSLMACLTVERKVEGSHSVVKRLVSHRVAGGSFVSLRLRLSEIAQQMEHKPFLDRLLANIERNPRKLASRLHVDQHPDLVALALTQGEHASKARDAYRHILIRVVYRCDAASQFNGLSDVRKSHEAGAKAEAKKAEPFRAPPEKIPLSFESLMAHAGALHFTEVARNQTWYSLPAEVLSLLTPLKDALRTPARINLQAPAPAEEEPLADDVTHIWQAVDASSISVSGDIFFQVLHATASKQKVLAPRPGAGRRIQQGEMLITVHEGKEADDGSPLLSIRPWVGNSSCSARLLNSSKLLERASDVCHRLQKWQPISELQYAFVDGPNDTEVVQVVSAMVAMGAFHAGEGFDRKSGLSVAPTDARLQATLSRLTHAGLVVNVSNKWYFTPLGAKNLCTFAGVRAPQRAIDVRPGLPISGKTHYELLRFLSERGWAWRKMPGKKPPPYLIADASDATRIFYSSGMEPYKP